jgi:hypothetical protein
MKRAPNKPAYGAPCNRCGECCKARLCQVGAALFTQGGPCPALIEQGDAYACGLVQAPQAYALVRSLIYGPEALSAAASLLIGTALGCDALLIDEPTDDRFDDLLRQDTTRRTADIRAALALWCEPLPHEYGEA